MSKLRIVNLTYKTFLPDLDDILEKAKEKTFSYEYFPVISYNENIYGEDTIVKEMDPFYLPMFFKLFESDIPIENLVKYLGDVKKEELSVAKRAFSKLNEFALQCSERIIADLSCQIILEKSSLFKEDHIIFFIKRLASSKMLGYLAYLNLNLENITICFLSYKPQDMITTVMSARTGKLLFDIHRLMSVSNSINFTSPYPGSSEDSLVQTFFHKPEDGFSKMEFLPIRIDIFCQGLLEPSIQKKKERIQSIFDNQVACPPYAIKKQEPSPYVRLPLGMQRSLLSWEEPIRSKQFFVDQIKENKE